MEIDIAEFLAFTVDTDKKVVEVHSERPGSTVGEGSSVHDNQTSVPKHHR